MYNYLLLLSMVRYYVSRMHFSNVNKPDIVHVFLTLFWNGIHWNYTEHRTSWLHYSHCIYILHGCFCEYLLVYACKWSTFFLYWLDLPGIFSFAFWGLNQSVNYPKETYVMGFKVNEMFGAKWVEAFTA